MDIFRTKIAKRVLDALLEAFFGYCREQLCNASLLRLLLVFQQRLSLDLAAASKRSEEYEPGWVVNLADVTADYCCALLGYCSRWVDTQSRLHVAAPSVGGVASSDDVRSSSSSPIATLVPQMLAALSSEWVCSLNPVNEGASPISTSTSTNSSTSTSTDAIGTTLMVKLMPSLLTVFKKLNAVNVSKENSGGDGDACDGGTTQARAQSRVAATASAVTYSSRETRTVKKGAKSYQECLHFPKADALSLRFSPSCATVGAGDSLAIRRGQGYSWKNDEIISAAALIPRLASLCGSRSGKKKKRQSQLA
jgi:hypothetical protein